MLHALSKGFFHALAGSPTIKRIASAYGMRSPRSFARRFIAGESLGEAIIAARALEARGLTLTLDLLGESVTSIEAASAATAGYLKTIETIVQAGITRNISLKLTQLGLDLDRPTALANLQRVLDVAALAGFFVRIDMESSPYVDVTLDTWETVWSRGYKNVGVVLQSSLYRTEADARRVIAAGGRIRLVKGAYNEPREIAHQSRTDVEAAFGRLMRLLLSEGYLPAIATHDEDLIEKTKAFAAAGGIGKDRFELQMLYGIRRDLQRTLAAEGYQMRIYVPYGREWFPYFMRRLGERPANVLFVLRAILRER